MNALLMLATAAVPFVLTAVALISKKEPRAAQLPEGDTSPGATQLGLAALALKIPVRGGRARGTVRGVEIELAARPGTGVSELEFEVVAALRPQLGLGLRLVPRVARILRTTREPLVDAELESRFQVHVVDRERAADVIAPGLETLLAAAAFGIELRADDRDVRGIIRLSEDASGVAEAVRLVAELAGKLGDAAILHPRSSLAEDVDERWSAVARGLGGRYLPRTHELLLDTDVGQLTADLERTADGGWETLIDLELARPLGLRFGLARRAEAKLWGQWTEPEVTFDDPFLDHAYVVRGEPTEQVRKLISGDVCVVLAKLEGIVDFLVVSEQLIALKVHRAMPDGRELVRLINLLRELAQSLSRASERAYR